jgi:hypothetical protein
MAIIVAAAAVITVYSGGALSGVMGPVASQAIMAMAVESGRQIATTALVTHGSVKEEFSGRGVLAAGLTSVAGSFASQLAPTFNNSVLNRGMQSTAQFAAGTAGRAAAGMDIDFWDSMMDFGLQVGANASLGSALGNGPLRAVPSAFASMAGQAIRNRDEGFSWGDLANSALMTVASELGTRLGTHLRDRPAAQPVSRAWTFNSSGAIVVVAATIVRGDASSSALSPVRFSSVEELVAKGLADQASRKELEALVAAYPDRYAFDDQGDFMQLGETISIDSFERQHRHDSEQMQQCYSPAYIEGQRTLRDVEAGTAALRRSDERQAELQTQATQLWQRHYQVAKITAQAYDVPIDAVLKGDYKPSLWVRNPLVQFFARTRDAFGWDAVGGFRGGNPLSEYGRELAVNWDTNALDGELEFTRDAYLAIARQIAEGAAGMNMYTAAAFGSYTIGGAVSHGLEHGFTAEQGEEIAVGVAFGALGWGLGKFGNLKVELPSLRGKGPAPDAPGSSRSPAQLEENSSTGTSTAVASTRGAASAPTNTPRFYDTKDQAGYAAISRYNPDSIADNLEYGGLIYQRPDGRYGHTPAIPGGQASVDPWAARDMVPEGATVVGDYHTHAAYSRLTDPNDVNSPLIRATEATETGYSNWFSAGDVSHTALTTMRTQDGYEAYLGTPSGDTFKMFWRWQNDGPTSREQYRWLDPSDFEPGR